MNTLDESALHGLNTLAGKSPVFDSVMAFFSVADLVKGGAFCLVIWWFWFLPRTRLEQRRDLLIAMLACTPAVATARAIALLAMFRPRPYDEPELHFVVPYSVDPESLLDWSAFPSDHAAMFMAMAVGLLFVNRRIGWMMIAYTVLIILLPRIYIGAHHPTDILAGAAIGIASAFLGRVPIIVRIGDWAMTLEQRAPSFFYTGLFLLSWQIATLFIPLREIGHFVKALVRA
jgi:undecaprenyl-diphosphatase